MKVFSSFIITIIIMHSFGSFCFGYESKQIMRLCRTFRSQLHQQGVEVPKDPFTDPICQRLNGLDKRYGIDEIHRRLKRFLKIRRRQKAYKICMAKFKFPQFCHRQVYNSLAEKACKGFQC